MRGSQELQTLLDERVPASRAEIGLERRLKSRIRGTFPAEFGAVGINGQPASANCFVENLSATGLYGRSEHQMSVGTELEVIVHLFVEGETGSTVETKGTVVRAEQLRDGSHGFAMVISRHKFL